MKCQHRFDQGLVAVSMAAAILFCPARAAAQPGAIADTCTAEDESLWTLAQDSVGLFAVDDSRAVGGAIGKVKAAKGSGFEFLNGLGGYHPVSGFKEMACGTLKNWTVYRLGRYERDLHPHVALSATFLPMLRMVPRGTPPSQTCDGCLWGEVTVPRDFEWFWRQHAPQDFDKGPGRGSFGCGSERSNSSQYDIKHWGYCQGQTQAMLGGRFCMYGPWVMEEGHEFRAEIHPVQSFWGQSDGHTKVYLMEDASRRFVTRGDFGQTYLSHRSFKGWGAPRVTTLYQVVRTSDGARTQILWEDADRTARERSAAETLAPFADIRSPDWAIPRLARACRPANSKSTQLVFEATLTIPKSGWLGLNVSGSNTGIRYSRALPAPEASSGQPAAEPRWRAVSTVSWNRARETALLNRRGSADAWGVLPDATLWMAVPEQNIYLDIIPEAEDEMPRGRWPQGLTADWQFVVRDLNRGGQVTASGVSVTIGHPRAVPTNPGDARSAKADRIPVVFKGIDPARPFAVVVRFNEGSLGREVQVPNLEIDVTARLTAPGFSATVPFKLYSIVPNFVAQVSGYDLEARGGAFPERLSRLFVSILTRQDKCPGGAESFARDIAGETAAAFEPRPLWSLWSPRLKAAGILRQATNHALEDGTMTFAEFREVNERFLVYRNACRPEPVRR